MSASMNRRHLITGVLLAAGLTVAWTTPGVAQGPPQRTPRRAAAAAPPGQYTVLEVQQMFDAYALMQAEQVLKLDEMQYPQFLSRLRALQQTRRRHLQARHQIVQELARLTAPQVAQADDAQIRDRLKALADLDGRVVIDVRAAYDAIDQILSVRQQARFRILEEQLERRKFDLLARARRVGAARPDPPAPSIK